MKRGLLALLSIMSLFPLFAATPRLLDPTISPTVVIEETGDVLTLRGIAYYKRAFENEYVGAFYSLHKFNTPQEALTDNGPKRMWIRFLMNDVPVKTLWESALVNNNSPDLLRREQIYVNQFLKMLEGPVAPGDVLIFDFIPHIGTKVFFKGMTKGTIAGEDFYLFILKGWMGRQPPSQKFKQDLFNFSYKERQT